MMDWKCFTIVVVVLLIMTTTQGTQDYMDFESERGFLVQLFVAADATHMPLERVQEIFGKANNVTSSEANVHLQIINTSLLSYESNRVTQNTWRRTILPKMSQNQRIKYDLAFVLVRNLLGSFPLRTAKSACNDVNFVNLINIKNGYITEWTTEHLVTLVAVMIKYNVLEKVPSSLSSQYFRNYADCQSTNRCVPGKEVCLNADLAPNDDRQEHNCFVLRPQTSCITNYEELTATEASTALTIHGNGIRELGEECDCFFRDRECKMTCDAFGKMITTTTVSTEDTTGTPSKHNHSWLVITIVVVLTVVVVIAFLVKIFLSHKRATLTIDDDAPQFSFNSENMYSKSEASIQ